MIPYDPNSGLLELKQGQPPISSEGRRKWAAVPVFIISAAQQVGYTPLPGGLFVQGTGKLATTTQVTPDGKGVVMKSLAKFRVAGWENGLYALGHFHRLAWVWTEVSIELDAGNPNATVKFAGSFVPWQAYYIDDVQQIGSYSMATNLAGVNQLLGSRYGSLGAGNPPL